MKVSWITWSQVPFSSPLRIAHSLRSQREHSILQLQPRGHILGPASRLSPEHPRWCKHSRGSRTHDLLSWPWCFSSFPFLTHMLTQRQQPKLSAQQLPPASALSSAIAPSGASKPGPPKSSMTTPFFRTGGMRLSPHSQNPRHTVMGASPWGWDLINSSFRKKPS